MLFSNNWHNSFLMFCKCLSCCSSSPVASNGDHPDSEIVVSVHGDASEHEEEEIRRKIELEAEERKLEETLEYQRRIEDEAKQKYLAEQHKKANRTIPEKHSDDESLLAGGHYYAEVLLCNRNSIELDLPVLKLYMLCVLIKIVNELMW